MAGTEGLQLVEEAATTREGGGKQEGDTLGSRKWLTPQRRLSNSSGPEPRDLVFISFLAKEVALVKEHLLKVAAVEAAPLEALSPLEIGIRAASEQP